MIRKFLQFQEVPQLITSQKNTYSGCVLFQNLSVSRFFPTVSWMVMWKKNHLLQLRCVYEIAEAVASKVEGGRDVPGQTLKEMGRFLVFGYFPGFFFHQKWGFYYIIQKTVWEKNHQTIVQIQKIPVGNWWKFINAPKLRSMGGIVMRSSEAFSHRSKLVTFIIGLWSVGSHCEGPGFVQKYVGLRVYTEGRSWTQPLSGTWSLSRWAQISKLASGPNITAARAVMLRGPCWCLVLGLLLLPEVR